MSCEFEHLQPFPRGAPASLFDLEHFGEFEAIFSCREKGEREKFHEVGVASPTQWELFLAIFHCAANGKDQGCICVPQTVLGN